MVSTPQQVALADAVKGINMFESPGIQVPVLGLVENMSWFTPAELPNNKYYIFGKEGAKNLLTRRDCVCWDRFQSCRVLWKEARMVAR